MTNPILIISGPSTRRRGMSRRSRNSIILSNVSSHKGPTSFRLLSYALLSLPLSPFPSPPIQASMGSVLSSARSFFAFSQIPTKSILVGLDAAGKTTILYRLKLGEVVTTIPTIGFNVETITYNKFTLTIWDAYCGGGASMGSVFSSVQSFFAFSQVPSKSILVGLDAAGKTTILYRLYLKENVTTIATIGFNVETITHNKFTLTVWDLGGGGFYPRMWHHYLEGMSGFIFVVDSSDIDRINEAMEVLWRVTSESESDGLPLLVYANKQDLNNAMSVAEIRDALKLKKMRWREWHIQGVCALTGEGLAEGLDWYIAQVQNNRR
ncbi:ADP-ribosylation factor family-domain-containing protein [Mortierella sp. GBAus27b]|nr:ADP-ribosylation factor family-domain-containing protein [Mortierella sp. GBAus27b]